MWYQRDEWGDLGMLDIVSCGEALHRPLKGGVYFVLFLIYFWPCCMACRILVPCPGIEPGPLAVRAPPGNSQGGVDNDLIYVFERSLSLQCRK